MKISCYNKSTEIKKPCKYHTYKALNQRRVRDSNPRSSLHRKTVFETAAFDRSANSPKRLQKYTNWPNSPRSFQIISD